MDNIRVLIKPLHSHLNEITEKNDKQLLHFFKVYISYNYYMMYTLT